MDLYDTEEAEPDVCWAVAVTFLHNPQDFTARTCKKEFMRKIVIAIKLLSVGYMNGLPMMHYEQELLPDNTMNATKVL